ncbi:hypothetical protein GJ496_001235 [Pomphorhynchus laevis]|nr:hypothetical protein GJ496_001235 [Pomphorhynchus laevis]
MPSDRFPPVDRMKRNQMSDISRYDSRNSRNCTIVISNVPPNEYFVEEDVHKMFHRFGSILNTYFYQHEYYIEFSNAESAKNALIQMNNYQYRGFKIKVYLADDSHVQSKYKQSRSSNPQPIDSNNMVGVNPGSDPAKDFVISPCVVLFNQKCPRYYPEYISNRIEKELKLNKCKIRAIPPNEKYEQAVFKTASEYNATIVIVVTQENIHYNSVSVNIFKQEVEEHRNMPLEDALVLIRQVMLSVNPMTHNDRYLNCDRAAKSLAPDRNLDCIPDRGGHERMLDHRTYDRDQNMIDYVPANDRFIEGRPYLHQVPPYDQSHDRGIADRHSHRRGELLKERIPPDYHLGDQLDRQPKKPYIERNTSFENSIIDSANRKRNKKPSITTLFKMLADGSHLDCAADYDDLIDYLKAKREQLCGPSRKIHKNAQDIHMNADQQHRELQATVSTLFGSHGSGSIIDKHNIPSNDFHSNSFNKDKPGMMCDPKANCSPAAAIAAAAAYFAAATANASQPNYGNQMFDSQPTGSYNFTPEQMFNSPNQGPNASWMGNDGGWNYGGKHK